MAGYGGMVISQNRLAAHIHTKPNETQSSRDPALTESSRNETRGVI